MNSARQGGILDLLPEHITLYLTTPMDRTERMLREILRRCGVEATEPYPYVLAVPVTPGEMHELGLEFASVLSMTERQLTKCWMALAGVEPTRAQLMQAQTLDDLVAWMDGQWLSDLLSEDRLTTFFQPIVHGQQPTEVFAYECLLRGQTPDGRLIAPERLYAAARATGMLPAVDAAARVTAVKSVAREDRGAVYFVNFNPGSFTTTKGCFDQTLETAESCGVPANRLVFEVVESEEIEDPTALSLILESCRGAGARVALDDLGAGYNSLHLLSLLKPDFIKLDMSLIRNVDRDPYKSRVASKLLEMARDINVGTVVEGVETVGEWQWLNEHGADYAQGFLFAPSAEPPESGFAGLQVEA